MGDLYLNVLPLSVATGEDTVVGRVWERDDELDDELRELPERGQAFHHYSFYQQTFMWAARGGSIPDDCVDRGAEATLGGLPAAVVAFAARQAAVEALVWKGFEAYGGSLRQPARLSRRKVNLAIGAVKTLPAGVGAYAAIAVQGFALHGDIAKPGPVALVVDQWVEHVLDVSLAQLAASGIDLVGARMRWRHAPGCECDRAATIGDAGRFLDGDPAGDINIRDRGGEQATVPAKCLAVHANGMMMARYLAGLNGRGERDISEALYQATAKFAKTGKRWENLEQTAKRFGELTLFPGTTATLQQPLLVPPAPKPSGGGPVALPPLPDANLNFQYGAPKLAENAARGLGKHGPYDEGQSRSDVLKAVIVAPQDFEAEAKKLRRILTEGLQRFVGLKDRYRLRDFDADIQLFADPTRAGYQNAVSAAAKSGVDIVFFVTKHEFRYARRGENPYLAAKAVLAAAGIASQAITVETLNQPDNSLQWSSDSVGLAAYTKVGNIPYVLHDPAGGRELVLGVARADIYDYTKGARRQRFGASVAVRQDGDFLFAGSTTPVDEDEDYETHLSNRLSEQIERFSTEQGGEPDRAVVYLFKRTGKRELAAINRAIGKRDIKFALLHINRDSPLWLVERDGKRISAPPRGTTVALSERDRLLVTGDPGKPSGSHPLRLTLDYNSTYQDMDRLVAQAYGFTKTTYRGFLQSNEPSPILFARLLVQKVEQLIPYGFSPATAAGPLGDNPWFT